MKKKLAFRIMLPLIILLISGYGSVLLANFDGYHDNFSETDGFSINQTNFFQHNLVDAFVIKKEQPFSKRNYIKLRAIDNEVDEDEVDTSDNQLVSNNYFANFYRSLSSSDKLINFKETATFQTVFYYLTTYKKYVLFQVFRI